MGGGGGGVGEGAIFNAHVTVLIIGVYPYNTESKTTGDINIIDGSKTCNIG